ncbi:hypothetical protein [Phytohabitans aurantiacus]|jgi:hypothetical protein|nr:hypothetical protein [Phytohabitans aurantiacus]
MGAAPFAPADDGGLHLGWAIAHLPPYEPEERARPDEEPDEAEDAS